METILNRDTLKGIWRDTLKGIWILHETEVPRLYDGEKSTATST